MKRVIPFVLLLACAGPAHAQQLPRSTPDELRAASPDSASPVRITLQAQGVQHGPLSIPVSAAPSVDHVALFINGIRHSEQHGPSMVFTVNLGLYLRRMRFRVVGYDAAGSELGQDEMVVNDPQPPFRVHAVAPQELPDGGFADISASVIAPPWDPVTRVDFYLGETLLGSDPNPPYSASFNVKAFNPLPAYVRATAIARSGAEAYDVRFFEGAVGESMDVVVKEVPLSVKGAPRAPLKLEDLTLVDSGSPRPIDSLLRASDRPLNLIILLDQSQSMLEELPVVKRAAVGFARSVLTGSNRVAIVAFSERAVWLTGFTSDLGAIEKSLDLLKPLGETHLYDATIEMMYTLQTMPGRRALVVLTDGVNQGGSFELDHLVHYARYSGVPIYPIIENHLLQKLRHIPFAKFDAERYARVADEAGASWFLIRSPSELGGVYREISTELQNQFIVRFRTESYARDTWHPLAVSTERKDVKLRVPRGYFP